MKDVTFMQSQSGGASLVMNEDYITTIVHHALFTKYTDPFSTRGVDLDQIRYKEKEDYQAFREKIKEDIEKFTDLTCTAVSFGLYKGYLHIVLEVVHEDKIYKLAVDPENKSISHFER